MQLKPSQLRACIDASHKWCNYISRHPKGFYYVVKGGGR